MFLVIGDQNNKRKGGTVICSLNRSQQWTLAAVKVNCIVGWISNIQQFGQRTLLFLYCAQFCISLYKKILQQRNTGMIKEHLLEEAKEVDFCST